MKQLLLVLGAAFLAVTPVALQAQDTTRAAADNSSPAAPRKLVVGKITDEKGNPLEDVTVQIKGGRTSTKTGSNGSYSINIPANGTLVFSFVGMAKQEINVAGKTTVDVQMQPFIENKLDEVIVVGYGSQKTREVTGSVATVDLKKLSDIPAATVTEALRGQMPGVSVSGGSTRPGTTPSISVRQQFNWGKDGGNEFPLIVIDDVIQIDPSTGLASLERFNMLDMSEVESITVLKDGSAAIYGSRASQGAIIIKTKRGKIGAPKISYSGKFENMDAISHGKVMNAQQYGIYSNRFARAAGWATATSFFTDAEIASMANINYDWLRNDWRASTTTQHSVDVSGGAEKATYFTGASYYTQGANLGSQDFSRWTFRAGTDVKLASNVRLSATIAANNSSLEKSFTKININDAFASGGEQKDYSILLHMPKYIPWQYTVNGVTRYVSPVLSARTLGSASGNNALSNWNYYASLNNGSKTFTKTFSYNANFSLQYDIPYIKGLSMKGNYAVSSSSSNNEQAQLATVLAHGNNLNTQGYHLYTDSTKWDALVTNTSSSRVSYANTTGTSEQMNFFLNYDNTFGDHKISGVLSAERVKNTWDQKTLLYENPIPGAYNGTSVTAGTINTSTTITYRRVSGSFSYLGRANYSYKGRYLAQFVFRTDASSRFAPENRSAFFPGLSLGWIMSDESWFRERFRGINNFKVRGSLAKTGNDNVQAWKWQQLYTIQTDKGMSFGTNGGSLTNGITPDGQANPDITWDKTIQRNLGFDVSMLKNRLSFTLDGYLNTTTDMLTNFAGALNVPFSVGGAFAEKNYSGVKTWGGELSVTWKSNVKDVNYSISMNFGYGDNKITKYIDQSFDYPSTVTTRKEVGQSTISPVWGFRTWKHTSTGDGMLRTDEDINNYWAYLTENANKSGVAGAVPKFMGITDKAQVKKGMLAFEDVAGALNMTDKTIAGPDGTIATSQDYVKLKNSSRTYSINTNLNASWKGLSFMAQLSTSWGGFNTIDVIKQATSSTSAMWAQPVYMSDMYDEVNNPNGKYPNMAYYDSFNGANSDFFSLPTFRCYVRSLSVGYTLPKDLVSKARFESARVFISGNNLWDFYNPYPDKYRNMYDSPTAEYPTLRTWALGINLGF